MLVYGRELRLPAQLGTDSPPPNTLLSDGECTDALHEYAHRLHSRLSFAWQAASHYTQEHQVARAADAACKGHQAASFNVNDRVARRLYDSANKLSYIYAGPYRVDADLGHGRYRLRDLENGRIFD